MALSGSASLSEARSISCALRALQTAQHLSLDVHSATDEHTLLLQLFARTQRYFPEMAGALKSPLDWVGNQLRQSGDQPLVLAHRDLHQKQLLMTKSSVGILDFDTACLSHPALDLGNLQAHVYFESIRNGHQSMPIEAALATALPLVSPQELKLWRCSALLRLAMIYAFTHEPESIVRALIDEASS